MHSLKLFTKRLKSFSFLCFLDFWPRWRNSEVIDRSSFQIHVQHCSSAQQIRLSHCSFGWLWLRASLVEIICEIFSRWSRSSQLRRLRHRCRYLSQGIDFFFSHFSTFQTEFRRFFRLFWSQSIFFSKVEMPGLKKIFFAIQGPVERGERAVARVQQNVVKVLSHSHANRRLEQPMRWWNGYETIINEQQTRPQITPWYGSQSLLAIKKG